MQTYISKKGYRAKRDELEKCCDQARFPGQLPVRDGADSITIKLTYREFDTVNKNAGLSDGSNKSDSYDVRFMYPDK